MVLTGLGLRGLSIFIFVLVLRIFMNVIEPTTGLESLNRHLAEFDIKQINETMMLKVLLGGLTTLILFQFILGKINLWMTLSTRKLVLTFLLKNPLNSHRETHLHISIDHFPAGFDALIKSLEILMFYTILLICIFYMSPIMGGAVITAVPIVLCILLIIGRKEVFVTQDFREARKTYQNNDTDKNMNKLITLSNKSFAFPFNDLINSQFSSNIAIVAIMLSYIAFYDNFQIQGFAAVTMVFSIRYSLLYAAELNRLLSRILKQRTIINKIETSTFS